MWKCGESGSRGSQSFFFFKHPTLLIQLPNCAALLYCWLKQLITHHSFGGSQLCVFSFERPLPGLCYKSWGRKELSRSGLKNQLRVMPCDSFKIPFPSRPSSTVSGSSLWTSALCQSGCTDSPPSIPPGNLSVTLIISLGRPVISSSYVPWPSHEALSLFQEGLDVSEFSIPQFGPHFEVTWLIKCILSIHTCQALSFSSCWNKKMGETWFYTEIHQRLRRN